MLRVVLAVSICALAASQRVNEPPVLPYDLARPTVVFKLPAELTEISALTDIDGMTVACVQDERAEVYYLSLHDGRVVRQLPFAAPGDYEGLTRVGSTLFALRSDGLIHHIREEGGRYVTMDTFRIAVPERNIEGLGYDEASERILISPKDFIKGDPATRDVRKLYALDPADPTHKANVVLTLSLDRLIQQARAKGFTIPMRTTNNGRRVSALKLRYSSVAVHPFTHTYYLLSAADRTLLVVDRAGELLYLATLDERLLPKAEGITFLPNGDLVLSSEGKGSAPVLVRYAYTP